MVEVFGKLNFKEDEEPRIIVDKVTLLPPAENLSDFVKSQKSESVKDSPTKSDKIVSKECMLYLRLDNLESLRYKKAKNLLELFPGNTRVVLYLTDSNKRLLAPKSLWVKLNDTLYSELCRVLGDSNVALK